MRDKDRAMLSAALLLFGAVSRGPVAGVLLSIVLSYRYRYQITEINSSFGTILLSYRSRTMILRSI